MTGTDDAQNDFIEKAETNNPETRDGGWIHDVIGINVVLEDTKKSMQCLLGRDTEPRETVPDGKEERRGLAHALTHCLDITQTRVAELQKLIDELERKF